MSLTLPLRRSGAFVFRLCHMPFGLQSCNVLTKEYPLNPSLIPFICKPRKGGVSFVKTHPSVVCGGDCCIERTFGLRKGDKLALFKTILLLFLQFKPEITILFVVCKALPTNEKIRW